MHRQTRLLSVLVCALCLGVASGADEEEDEAGPFRSEVRLMFHRDQRRPLSRTVTDIQQLIDEAEEVTFQLGFTVVGQHASDTSTDRREKRHGPDPRHRRS